MDDLPKDYETLVKSYQAIQRNLEERNQALYKSQRQLEIAMVLQGEYQEEINNLQTGDSQTRKNFLDKIQQLEEKQANLKINYDERIISLEREASLKDQEIGELKLQLATVIELSNPTPNNDSAVLEDLASLRKENEELKKNLEKAQDTCSTKQKQIEKNEEIISHLQTDLANLQEILKCKRNELCETNNLIQNLQDDLACVKIELDTLKSKPLDAETKGNSLFAEVNDSRVKLQEYVNRLKEKFIEMKQERDIHLKKISALTNENVFQCSRWENEIKGVTRDQDSIIAHYKAEVKTLKELNEAYKRDSFTKKYDFGRDPAGNLQIFESMLNSKKEEIQSLREELSLKSLNQTLVSLDLASAHQETRKWKMESAKFKNELSQLKIKLEEIQLKSPNETKFDDNTLPSSLITENSKVKMEVIEELDDTKINDTLLESFTANVNISKKVKFTDDISEPKVQNITYRGARNVLASKPVYMKSALNK